MPAFFIFTVASGPVCRNVARVNNPFRARPLTGLRIGLAMGIAVATDAIQFALGPLGWTFFDEAMDVIAMVLISLLVGFHPLLLPTFVVEFIPIVDMLPTWTGCVGAVILLRKRAQSKAVQPSPATPPASSAAPEPPPSSGPVIDV